MLQLPHFFWNHLSTATANAAPLGSDVNAQEWSWNELLNFEDPTPGPGIDETMDTQPYQLGTGQTMFEPPTNVWSISNTTGPDYSSMPFTQGANTPSSLRSDQAAISAALMSFMADMAKAT